MTEKLYAERDIIAQGEFYTRHVCAMTAEGLWDKSSIAAELAHRDQRIAELEEALRPFAREAERIPDSTPGEVGRLDEGFLLILIRDFRRARALLQEES